ncbi:MAG: hypothetical protein PWP07_1569 [Epulopiscium sp.]|jgi:hypothetical protein|uniref:Uncharacterized protein n=1 Tax=Defluviitalea raffinosedens TaxID=1450156 RepID=A0A7C8LMA2_9FIRM|nr:hypothetical protein [Defluviitalea raffinosedens]MBZ4667956.1 hypothetical protein [Defluviitaleaceae bacterium]MDK2788324.1 hypothetical protein [Candidatus Epulonipiscium sp.]KAE9637003.1 hypothetical protein GND95_00810 [Defluviitalea raffinosedens]MBM7685242.1 hypothetical protein [Defluviitalea raffinosedens]HHW67319.1 hypothetical protein [Candidatus Epulonipiscium sp.]
MRSEAKKRHYRVAQREIEQSPNKGVFIANEKKQTYILFAIGIFLFTFVQGFILGYFVSRD